MKSAYAVIVADEAGERCEGLHGTIREALDRVRSVIASGLAQEGWVVTLIATTQAFTKQQDGDMCRPRFSAEAFREAEKLEVMIGEVITNRL